MFATCVYCHGALGANEVVEPFPVGRKLAFDSTRGRLWVVCPRCSRWNLSPLEERWEALDACERLYRSTPLKASTDNIGLARLSEGLQLVRVGQPTRPEFAAWRYGDVFRRRRFSTHAVGYGSLALMLGLYGLEYLNPAVHGSIPLLGTVPSAIHYWFMYRVHLQRVGHVEHQGERVALRRSDLGNIRLEPVEGGASGEAWWQLNVLHKRGRSILSGGEAERVLGRALTVVNEEGGSRDTVTSAVKQLADAGSAEAFMRQYLTTKKGPFNGTWREVPREQVLALEMALHEDTERAALEGDLAALERAWEEAEQIAAIADNLLLPAWVQQRLPKAR